MDLQKTPRSRPALASLGNVIHNFDANLQRWPQDGSANFTLTVPGELERFREDVAERSGQEHRSRARNLL